MWAKTVNDYFEKQGNETRIDHRSYKRQGIDKIPSIHLGVAAHQMERRGIRTERGNINHDIEIANQQLRQLKARINKLKNWIKEEAANTEPPTLADVIQNILNTGENKNRYEKIYNLKSAAKIFSFLQQNNILDMTDLENKVISMYVEQGEIRDKLKPVERRLKTLKEHFKQAEFYVKYKSFYDHWQKLPPKKQPQYYEDFRRELSLFEAAKRHFDKCMKEGYKTLPIKKWKAEQAELTAKQAVLYNDYKELKEEVNEVTIIQRNIKDIIRENRPQQRTLGQDMEI